MSSEFSVNMNEYLPLRDVVFNTLRQAILKGELKPGERLMEIALAERLGVSRTPIREAMRKLELEGLVVMIPRRGAQVANITEKDLNDVLEVRITLENMAIEKACANMTDKDVRKLELAAQDFQKSTAEGDLVKLAEADVNFHEAIYRAADNKRLMQVLNNLREQIYRYRVEYLKEDEARNRLVKEHEEITDAIRNRDVKKAQELSFEHLEHQRMRLHYLSPQQRMNENRKRVAEYEEKLTGRMEELLRERRHRLALLAGTLESYSPVKKLSGGYAFVEDGNHQALRSIHQIRKKDTVQIHLLDGTLTAAVTEIQAAEGVKNE